MDLIDININYCVWKEKFTDILIIQNLDSEVTNLVMQTKTMLRKAMHVNKVSSITNTCLYDIQKTLK